MFDVGGPELLLIILAVIILFGPKKIPEMMQNLGKGIAKLRSAQNQFRDQINNIQTDLKDTAGVNPDDFNLNKALDDSEVYRPRYVPPEKIYTKEFQDEKREIERSNHPDESEFRVKKPPERPVSRDEKEEGEEQPSDNPEQEDEKSEESGKKE